MYYVYLLRNYSDTLYYVGVTNNLARRIYEHREKINQSYTSKYNINILVWYEVHQDIKEAIAREKQIKGWRREKKRDLISRFNLSNQDLWSEIIK